MKKQISRISIAQTSKVVAALYALLGLIYTVIGLLMLVFGGTHMKILGATYVCMPIIGGLFGFLFSALAFWAYNKIAKSLGGFEFEVSDIEHAG